MSSEKWNKYKLGELVDNQRGISYGIVQPGTFKKTGIPIIKVNNLTEKKIAFDNLDKVDEEIESKYQRTRLRGNEILISLVGTLGHVLLVKDSMIGWNVARAIGVIPIDGKFDKKWIYWFLQSPEFQETIRNVASTSVQATLNLKELNEIEVLYPSTESVRSKIVNILTALDDKIELNRRMNETLEGIAQAVWEEWFGKTDMDNPIELSELVELNPRISISKGEEVVYVEMRDVPQNGMCVSGYVQKSFTSGSKFQANDTLLARITPCLENGKTAFVNFLDSGEKAFGSTEFIVMRAKEGVSPYYVYFVARDERFRQFAISSMVGSSGRQRVQTEVLPSFDVEKPDSQAMVAFHEFAKPIFEKIFENFQQSCTLAALRDVLLPQLMREEMRV